jgi:hypothetical protein
MNDNPLMLHTPLEIEPGIILRRGCKRDAEKLAEFNGRIHGDDEDEKRRVAIWSRDLVKGLHPSIRPEDFTIIEEKKSGKILSSMNLISQIWTYDGIPFRVGRPEVVGTDPEYRHRGLVRSQFNAVHVWSRSRGEMVQAITGIPFYYRQFGYEMTVELDNWRAGYEANVPALKKDETEKYLFRKATIEDIPYLQKSYVKSQQRYRLCCKRDRKIWEYDLTGRKMEDICRREIMIITTREGKRAGVIVHPYFVHNDFFEVPYLEIDEPFNWIETAPSVVRYLWNKGQEYAKKSNKKCLSFHLVLGSEHPFYASAGHLAPRTRSPYAWYMRIENVLGFLRLIQPALEARLACSELNRFSGELRIGFYSNGINMNIKKGIIHVIQPYILKNWEDADTGFPNFTFLHLIFGGKSIEELRAVYPDCWVKEEKRGLLNILFPKQLSNIWPLE